VHQTTARNRTQKMKIAVTGGSGALGRAILAEALRQGHRVVAIDRVASAHGLKHENLSCVTADICDYGKLVRAFEGCDGLIHMAAIPTPGNHRDHIIHNNNVVGSYNAMRAAIECGIVRICQASSVNAIGLAFSRTPRFDYFPIDERHPNYCEEPYSLSKWICEQQADSLARRYETVGIASMRFHYVVDERAIAAEVFGAQNPVGIKHLWAYVRFDASARACLLALDAPFVGHEVFYIVAPDTTVDVPSAELAARYYPDVPIVGELGGSGSFFSSRKAHKLLGWSHAGEPVKLHAN